MTEARTLNINLKLRDELSRSISRSRQAIKTFATASRNSLRRVKTAVTGLTKTIFSLKTAVIGLIGASVIAGFKSLSDSIDRVAKQAKAIGESPENLSVLEAAFEQAGGSADQLRSILSNLTKASQSAQDEGSAAAEAFKKLSISATDLRDSSPAALIEKMAAGLENFNDAGQRAQVLSQILPEGFVQIGPLISQGLDDFQKQIERVRKLGAEVTSEQARVAEAVSGAFGEVRIALQGIGKQVLVAFGPATVAALEATAEFLAENRDTARQVAVAVGEGVVTAFRLAVQAVIGLVRTIESIPGVKLIDLEETERDIRAIERKLRIIDEARNGTLSRQAARVRELANADPFGGLGSKNVRRARRELPGLERDIARAQDENLVEQLVGRESELRRRLDELRTIANGGLAAQLEDMRSTIAQSIGSAVADVRKRVADSDSPSLTDSVLGTVEVMRKRGEKLVSVFKKTATDAANAVKAIVPNAKKEKEDDKKKDPEPLGFEKSLQNALKRSKDIIADFSGFVGRSIGQVAERSLDSFANQFANVVTGVRNAKEAFQDFARAFLADIARMIAKSIVLGAVKTLFNLADGGVTAPVDETRPVRAFARGGVARRPTLAVFGEGRNAEAFVPLPDNRSIPVTFTGTGGDGMGGGVVNHFHINAMDSQDVARVLTDHQGVLRNIWQAQVETRVGTRQAIQRAAR